MKTNRTDPAEITGLNSKDFMENLETHARRGRNPCEPGDWEAASESLRRLLLYVGRTLAIRSLSGGDIIEKSHFEQIPYRLDPKWGYVTDKRQPYVHEAIGRLDVIPAFSDDIRLKGSERGFLLPRDVFYHVQILDVNLEPRVSVEVLDIK